MDANITIQRTVASSENTLFTGCFHSIWCAILLTKQTAITITELKRNS